MIANTNKNMERSKLLAVVAVLAMALCVCAVAIPAEETDAASDITYVSGVIDKPMEFSIGNKIVVDKDLSITNGATLTIPSGASLTVNEGITLSIDKGTLQIDSGALVTVDGTVEVNREGVLNNETTYKANDDTKAVESGYMVNGALEVAKQGKIAGKGQIILGADATMDVQSSGKNHGSVVDQTIMMNDGAVFTANGDLSNVTVEAYAADAVITSKAVITYQIPANATSTFNKLTFTATASTIDAYKDGDAGKVVKESVKAMSLDIAGTASTATVEIAGTEGASTETSVPTTIAVSGMQSSVYFLDEKKTEAATVYATVSGTLRIAEGSVIDAECLSVPGTLVVAGTADIDVADVAGTATFNGKATIAGDLEVAGTADFNGETIFNGVVAAVSGALDIAADDKTASYTLTDSYLNIVENGTAKIAEYDDSLKAYSGAYYIDDNGAANFSAFAVALEAANSIKATEVHIGGYTDNVYSIAQDITVSGLELCVDGTVQVAEGYTLTIAEDSGVTTEDKGLIVVEGTLVDNADCSFGDASIDTVENVPANDVGVKAEVMTTDEDNTYYSYTTLANALSGMTSGTVSLFGAVDVDANMEIPAGVTVITNGKNLTVKNGVDLAINGVVEITDNGNIVIDEPAADVKDAKKGTVTVNNYIVGIPGIATQYNGISGFYATGAIGEDEGNLIMSADVAAANAAEMTSDINMFGTLTVGDVAFTDADGTQTLNVNGKLTAGTVTIDGFKVVVGNGAVFNGTVANAEGSVVLTNITSGSADPATISDITEEEAGRLVVSGTPAAMTPEKEGEKAPASTIVFAGTVYIGTADLSVLKDVTVPAGATVNVAGALTINAEGSETVNTLTVEGTLAVMNGASVEADVLNVIGTVTVAAATDDDAAGTLSVDNVYAGITKDDVDNGKAVSQTAAVIDGDVTVTECAYVAPGATLSEGFTEGKLSATFSVEGSEWFTAYKAGEAADINVNKAPIANGYFQGWATEEDGDVVYKGEQETPAAIPMEAEGVTYYSVGDYEIYSVTVVADDGVGAIYIGGVVLQKSGNTFVTMFDMTAGAKEISVVAKNGYTAENVQITGTGVSGNTLTLAGTTNTEIVLYVTGTQIADQEPVATDDGMGVTDYLLIVLVVLVVVLAIVVVMRMMRS